jgi:GTPase
VTVTRSGFVTLVGRPNAGKSTLLNRILGEKVSIVSNKPQTTRSRVMGVLHDGSSQIVFVDTPGIHKPVTALGERLNETAQNAVADVDVVCILVDATKPIGKGDRYVASRVPKDGVLVLNKIDRATPQQVLSQLSAAADLGLAEYFPLSARTGEGVDEFVAYLMTRLPEGPAYFPDDMMSDVPETVQVAELVREQLFRILREEMPYSIATRVTEWDLPRISVDIVVERESQKPMVIGKGGRVLKEVGIAVRKQLPEGRHLMLRVVVEKDWQRKRHSVDRLLNYELEDDL